ncbi:hypothetical protein CLOP_g4170 [Closterium sp. NIES-67]|nr:hypothetical protein CLOP_g4170 [Closterium sp. NIES-67]
MKEQQTQQPQMSQQQSQMSQPSQQLSQQQMQEQLQAALDRLLLANDPAAGQWLGAFQQSQEAWQVTHSILASAASLLASSSSSQPPQGMSPSANALILFAAQTLRSKVQLQLSALDSSARAALLSALFSLFQSFCCAPNQHQVLLQICASISALLLQSPGTAADLEARLAAAMSAAEGGGGGGGVGGVLGGVVELLGAVGDECTDEQRWSVGVVTLQRKHVFCLELLSHSKFVALLLQRASSLSLSALSQSQTTPASAASGPVAAVDPSAALSLLHKTLRCLFAWVRIGFLTDLLAADTWQSHVLPLVELAVDSLQEPCLCEVAAEVVGEMASRHEPLLPAITPRLLSCFSQAAAAHPDAFPPLASAASNPSSSAAGVSGSGGSSSSGVDEEERERLVAAFASAIADVGLASPAHVVLSPQLRDPFAAAALRCASVHSSDHRIAISLLPLWSGLSEFLSARVNSSSSSTTPPLTPQDAAAVQAILLAALPVCLSHAKLSTVVPGGAMGDEGDEEEQAEAEAAAEDYREQLEESLVDVMRAVGAGNYLSTVAPLLLSSALPNPQQLLADMPAVELQLFASQAAGQVADSDRPEDVAWACQVLSAVAYIASGVAESAQSSIPPRLQPWVHRAIAANVLAYLSFLPRVPSIVPALLQSLAHGLVPPTSQGASAAGARQAATRSSNSSRASEQATSACAAALCALCEAHNTSASTAAAAASASLNEGLVAQLVAVGENLHLSRLQPKQEADVITAVASAVSSLPPAHQLLALQRLLHPVLAALQALEQQPSSRSLCEAAACSFTRLALLLEHIRLPSPETQRLDSQLLQCLQQLPPSLQSPELQQQAGAQPGAQPGADRTRGGEGSGAIQAFLLAACWPHLQFLLSLPSSSSSSASAPSLDRDALTTAVAAAARCLSPLATLSGPAFLPYTNPALSSLQTAFSTAGPPPSPLSLSACPSILRAAESLLSLQAHATADHLQVSADQLQLSASLATSALVSFVSAPACTALKSPKGAEQHPDITEALLHFASSLLSLVPPSHLASDSSSPVLPPLAHLLEVAARGCTAAHRGVSSSSFSFISALMTAATQQASSPSLQSQPQSQSQQVAPLVQLCTAHGPLLSHALVAALLGPNAVSRVQKCVTLLQQLFHVCCCAAQGATPGATAAQAAAQAALAPMHQWLVAALSSLPPGFLKAGEAEAILPAWLTQLASAPPALTPSANEGERGNTRMLRRLLRSFADSHRHTAVGA